MAAKTKKLGVSAVRPGSSVIFRLGGVEVVGVVTADRGHVAPNGERVLSVRAMLSDLVEPFEADFPESWLRPVRAAVA